MQMLIWDRYMSHETDRVKRLLTSWSSCLKIVLIVLGVVQVSSAAGNEVEPPNVIVIYTDDQGSLDLNCYGSTDLETPNLDRLAEQGVRFTSMYAPSAICSASRAGLMTGRFPARAGVPGNVSSTEGVAGMPTSEVTMAELLKAQGYATGHIGKWHLGYSKDTMPNQQGFDYSFGHMGGCIDNYSHFFYWNGPNRHDLWRNAKEVFHDGEFFLDLMVSEGRAFIDNHKSRPFFLYWAINAPHYPMQGTSRWRHRYRDLPEPRRQYAEFVSTVDEKIGELLARLDRYGLRRKTLVIVQSDHGHSTEERAFWGGGNAGHRRGAKACLFEGGINVPSIASLPGLVAEGETCDAMVTGCDWFPTIAELCGAKLPERPCDGKSILHLLKKPTAESPHKHLFWLLGSGKNPQWAVRKGRWKLLHNAKDTTDRRKSVKVESPFLVDLSLDPGEASNVAQGHPGVVAELTAWAEEQMKSISQEEH